MITAKSSREIESFSICEHLLGRNRRNRNSNHSCVSLRVERIRVKSDAFMAGVTEQQFREIKERGEAFYRSINEVYCPYLKEKVSFGAPGLEHLKFKRREKARLEQDQYMRFKLIHLAPEILKASHTLQGLFETKKFERVRVHSRTDTILKLVTYYEFIAVIKRNRVRIIVKQIENGQRFFWSIVPFWGMNEETMTRLLHDGVPEED